MSPFFRLALILVPSVLLAQQAPPPPIPPPPPVKYPPIRIGASFAMAFVIHKERIPCERWAGPPATVLYEVLASTTGTISGVKLLKGNRKLAGLVAPALKKWRFRPILLCCGAAPMLTQIEVSCPDEKDTKNDEELP